MGLRTPSVWGEPRCERCEYQPRNGAGSAVARKTCKVATPAGIQGDGSRFGRNTFRLIEEFQRIAGGTRKGEVRPPVRLPRAMMLHIPVIIGGITVCARCMGRPRSRLVARAWAGSACDPNEPPSEAALAALRGGDPPQGLGPVAQEWVGRWLVRARAGPALHAFLAASKEA